MIVIDITEHRVYRFTLDDGRPPSSAKDTVWAMLEDGCEPDDITHHITTAEVDDVRVREAYDWETPQPPNIPIEVAS